MTDRTNLDVAADEIERVVKSDLDYATEHDVARAALDAIHPALADLTPDDVAAIFALVMTVNDKWVARD